MTGLRSSLAPLLPRPATIAACLSCLVLFPLGALLVRSRNIDPMLTQGVAAPIAYALVAMVVVGALALWVNGPWVVGLAAGTFAAWAGVAVTASLVGTPFGYGSMLGDAGRMSALATYFSTTWVPGDAADPSLPPEYPPLYPMVVGRVAALTDHPAWSLLGEAQAVFTALALLVGFLAWSRIVPPAVALAVCGTVWAGLSEPSKAYEVLALAIFVPLVIGTFAPPPDRRPVHPVLAGVLFGVMVPLYPNFLILSLVGMGMVLAVGWWTSAARRSFLLRSLVTVGLAALISSWYLAPLVVSYATGETEVVADLFRSGILASGQFPLFDASSQVVRALQILGLAGIVLFWRAAFWARPLGLLAGGIFALKSLVLLRFTGDGHSFMLLYIPYVLRYLFAAAGVLTAFELARLAAPHLQSLAVPRRLAGVVSVGAVVGLFASYAYNGGWAVLPAGVADVNGAAAAVRTTGASYSALAHAEYRPDGRPPAYRWPRMTRPFPADDVYALIDADLGKGATPVVLSDDQRLFSFRWFPNYLPPARESSNALTRWDSRAAELREIARTTDSRALAEQLSSTEFGHVDVLVLRESKGRLTFGQIEFSKGALDGPAFTAHHGLPGGYAVFTRRS